MATQYTSLLGLALPVTGELSGSWGDTVNVAITSLLDNAVAGTTSITVDADITLTTTVGLANQSRQAIILWSPASGTTTRNITAPAQSKIYTVINASGGTQAIVFRGAGPTTGVTIVKGESAVVAWNGTDFIKVSNTGGSAAFTNVTVSGTTTLSGLTASTALALDASKNVVSVTNTGTGNNVLATSPTLVTPTLGTPASVTLTNATGLPVSTGISGFGTGVATALAVNVGSAGAPVLFNGALGTPSSGTVTNLTGTASININGTVGATTASTGAFTTLTTSSTVTHNAGTANGVAYLNGSKVLTTGSALTFDGTNLGLGTASPSGASGTTFAINGGAGQTRLALKNNGSGDTSSDGFQIALLSDGVNVVYQNRESGYQAWEGNGSELMRLTSTGLGIGTSSPTLKLQVAAASGASAVIGITNNTSGKTYRLYSADAGDNGFNGFGIFDGTAYRVVLDTSGNLGIGTSSPGARLDVSVGTNTIAQQWQGAGTNFTLRLKSGNGATPSSSVYRLYMDYLNGTGSNGYIDFYRGGGGTDGWLVFGTSGVDKMTLDSSGNLGLGVTPSAWATLRPLQIGNAAISGAGTQVSLHSNNFFNGSNFIYATSAAASLYQSNSGAHLWYTAPSGTAGNAISFTQAMTLDASGRLGVGVTSPGAPIDINNTTSQDIIALRYSTLNKVAGVYLDSASVYYGAGSFNYTNAFVAGHSANYVAFNTAGTERARIDSSGNLLVGCTDTLAYNPGVRITPTSIGVANTSATSTDYLGYFNRQSGTGEALRFGQANGTVGTISVTASATAYNTSSDYRLKEDIQPMIGALAKVAALKPCTYKWKVDGSDGEGFIAHELAEVVPQCVTGEKDAVDAEGKPQYQGIDTSFLVATLTAALQEAHGLIKDLQARVDALEGK